MKGTSGNGTSSLRGVARPLNHYTMEAARWVGVNNLFNMEYTRRLTDYNIQGGPEKRTYLSVDNLVTVSVRKACDVSNNSECCIEKVQNLNSVAFFA